MYKNMRLIVSLVGDRQVGNVESINDQSDELDGWCNKTITNEEVKRTCRNRATRPKVMSWFQKIALKTQKQGSHFLISTRIWFLLILLIAVTALDEMTLVKTELVTRFPVNNKYVPKGKILDSMGQSKCFKKSFVNRSASCATCVNFITIANRASRWGSVEPILAGLHMVSTNLRISQPCFKLHVYTNIDPKSKAGLKMRMAGGPGVLLYPFPTDLPRNGYSGKNGWMELSRKKLDLVVRHTALHGHKVIWTDLDTAVFTDLSCAYTQLPHFVVSRHSLWPNVMLDPSHKSIRIRDGYSVYGDLWMVDTQLVDQVQWLERAGMPPPRFDLQDFFSYLMNRCNGTIVDLRGYLTAGDGSPMCMGFDFANGYHPSPDKLNPMRIVNGTLQCSVQRENGSVFAEMATLSMTFPLMQQYIRNSYSAMFKNPELSKWAQIHGFGSPSKEQQWSHELKR